MEEEHKSQIVIEIKPTKRRLHTKVFDWVKKHHIKSTIIFVVILSAIGAYINLVVIKQMEPKKVEPVKPTKKVAEKPKVKYYSPLTGAEVANEAATTQAVTGVMIENSPEARPQSGLKESGVVFEAIAEGGITRFLALYQENKPQLIGPVRSVRPYYISWAAAFDCSIAHVGGSDAALAEVRNGSYRDIDQFFNSSTYWRSTDRYAPHNMYTSFEKLDALNAAKGYTTSTFTGFTRIDGKAVEIPDASNINVTISSTLFNSSYVYDKKTNTYARSQAGAAHLDREDGQITPSVVAIMKVNESTLQEYGNHQDIETIGSGEAYIFQNGTVRTATWSKAAKTEQIMFTDSTTAEEIPLARGQTWITAVPIGTGDVTWS